MIDWLSIDTTSSVAPSEQLRSRLAAAIGAGSLAAGARLPTVRALAADLGLAVNTVAKAYRALESAGLIETHGRAGTVVSATGDAARERVVRAAAAYAQTVAEQGVPAEDGLAIVRAALQDLRAP